MFHSLLYRAWTLHPFGSSLLRVRLVIKILNLESGHCRHGIGWKTRVKFVSSHWSFSVPPRYSLVLANEPCSPICNVPCSWKVSALYWLSSCLQLILQVPCRSGSLLWPKTLLWHLVPRTGFTLRSLYKITLTSASLHGSSFTYASCTWPWLTFAISVVIWVSSLVSGVTQLEEKSIRTGSAVSNFFCGFLYVTLWVEFSDCFFSLFLFGPLDLDKVVKLVAFRA